MNVSFNHLLDNPHPVQPLLVQATGSEYLSDQHENEAVFSFPFNIWLYEPQVVKCLRLREMLSTFLPKKVNFLVKRGFDLQILLVQLVEQPEYHVLFVTHLQRDSCK